MCASGAHLVFNMGFEIELPVYSAMVLRIVLAFLLLPTVVAMLLCRTARVLRGVRVRAVMQILPVCPLCPVEHFFAAGQRKIGARKCV